MIVDDDELIAVPLEHEPGQVVKLRRLGWEVWANLRELEPVEMARTLLVRSIAEWTYPQEITEANIARLDVKTSNVLALAIQRLNNVDPPTPASSNGSTSAIALTQLD